jgi:4-amino-4-deoxy-L-arabinose transferase-like glycosyltransferase
MRRYFLPLATLILLVAAVLRLWQLHLYPPGPHYDEGAYLLITRSIAFGGARFFPIVEAYQGREVLYMYLNAPLLHLFGDRIYTLHLSSAFINLITIAAAMRLAREMFRGERGVVIALAVGVAAAISFPQIFIARQAFRAVSLPMMQALGLLFLWRGLRAGRGGWFWLALGGFFSGGAIYTYMASRLFALWLALGGLVLLWVDREQWRLRLRQAVVFFGVMLVVMLPMVVYAVQKPDIFWGRLGEVTQVGEAISLLESVLLHLQMFFLKGDPYLRYNIPDRPYFTLLEGILLLVGIAVALWRLNQRRQPPLERVAYALALLSPLMVIPSVISVGGLPPSHMRSLGMIPLIFVLVGIGAEAAFKWLAAQGRVRREGLIASVLVAALLVGLLVVGQSYFDWAARADLFYETDADLALAAQWLAAQAIDADTQVYLAARDRSHPTVQIEQTPPITWLGTDTLFRPPAGQTGLYVFPRSAPPPADWRAWLEAGHIADLPLAPDGRTAFEAFRMGNEMPLPSLIVTEGALPRNEYLSLRGIQTSPVAAGSTGEIVAYWDVLQSPPDSDLTPLIQLEDALGNVFYRGDVYLTDTDRWAVGSVFALRLPVSVPIGTVPERYTVRLAWVARAADRYAQYLNEEGHSAGIWATIGGVDVLRPPVMPDLLDFDVALAQDAWLTQYIRLFGSDNVQTTLRPGEYLSLRLYWEAFIDMPASTAYQIALRDREGRDTLLWNAEPLASRYPTSQWQQGEKLIEWLRLQIDIQQPSGEYRLLLRGNGVETSLGVARVEGVARLMEAPSVANAVGAVFGEVIALHGYSLDVNEAEISLSIVWSMIEPVTTNYTVFVHLVDAEGAIILQRDAMPQNNQYPTSLWLAGEYVIDEYVFASPDTSAAAVRLGLYDAATGQRLLVMTDNSWDYVEVSIVR